MTQLNKVTIHTDGSALGNPGPGGWAAILSYKDQKKEISGGFACTTNNRMEVLAAIMALEKLKFSCYVDLYTDSRYLRDAVEKQWIDSWVKKNWVNSAKKPVKNKDLWLRLLPLMSKHQVHFHWLRGHTGQCENERCDELARKAAQKNPTEIDSGYEKNA